MEDLDVKHNHPVYMAAALLLETPTFAVGVAILFVTMVLSIAPTKWDSLPGAGPVLVEALRSGWEPPAEAPRPLSTEAEHECGMCGVKCCTRCNVVDRCCCLSVTHCACPPDAWGSGSPELRGR